MGAPVDDTGNRLTTEAVFEELGVGRDKYDSSMVFYTKHPEELIAIYDEVLNEISRRQATLSESAQKEGKSPGAASSDSILEEAMEDEDFDDLEELSVD